MASLKPLYFILLLLSCQSFATKAQNLDWAKKPDETGTGTMSQAYSVAVDARGSVYTTGYFMHTVDFDPGTGVYNLTALNEDIFIQKLDASGNFVWAKRIGGILNDGARSITADSFGNIYITGLFSDTVDFDPGPGVFNLISTAGSDVFILKLDTAGNFIWAKAILQTAGGYANNEGQGITVDHTGNVYVTGGFTYTVDFDPGPGVFSMTSAPAAHGNGFIEKLDSSGNFLWAKDIGVGHTTAGFTYCGSNGMSIAIDAAGNIYTAGTFKDTVDADPGAGTTYLFSASSSGMATFISKLDPSGNFLWAKQISGVTGDCYVNSGSLGLDTNGNVLFTGTFDYTIDIDPGPAVYNITSASTTAQFNSFVEKLDPSGNLVWGKVVYAPADAQAEALIVDKSGYIYSTGFFTGNVDFDPGPGTYFLTYTSTTFGYDYYVQKLDNNGNFLSAFQSDGSTSIQGAALAVDGKRNIYLAGILSGSYDFDPGPGTYTLSTSGLDAMFAAKFDQTRLGSGSAVACGSYSTGTQVYTVSGTYTDTLISSIGSDSLLTLALTVNPLPATGTIAGPDSVCIGHTMTLTDATTGGIWSATNLYATISGGIVTGVTAGNDTIKYTVTNSTTGCTAFASLAIRVKSCTPNNIVTVAGQEVNFHIAPNPNNGNFQFYVPAGKSKEVMAVITNVLGQKVKEFMVFTDVETQVSLDVTPGVYFLSIADGNNKFTQKILVKR